MTSLSSSPQPQSADAIERQALAWMGRVTSGRMTQDDGAALRRWCQADPAHRAALAAARRRGELLRVAGERVAAQAASASPSARAQGVRGASGFAPGRRAVLGGALGFTAAAAAAAMVHPPLGLWPSIDELRADHRTGIGERRSVALTDDVSVELNTCTSIAMRGGATAPACAIELIAGEAAIDMRGTRQRITVDADAGRAMAQGARFALRRSAGSVCVNCLEGRLEVTHPAGSAVLGSRQQLIYDERSLGAVTGVSVTELARRMAWREGYLRFVDTPLGEVIDEINRYRPGKVVLLDRQLAARKMTGRFQIAALDLAIAQLKRSLGLDVRALPGGVVLLS